MADPSRHGALRNWFPSLLLATLPIAFCAAKSAALCKTLSTNPWRQWTKPLQTCLPHLKGQGIEFSFVSRVREGQILLCCLSESMGWRGSKTASHTSARRPLATCRQRPVVLFFRHRRPHKSFDRFILISARFLNFIKTFTSGHRTLSPTASPRRVLWT